METDKDSIAVYAQIKGVRAAIRRAAEAIERGADIEALKHLERAERHTIEAEVAAGGQAGALRHYRSAR